MSNHEIEQLAEAREMISLLVSLTATVAKTEKDALIGQLDEVRGQCYQATEKALPVMARIDTFLNMRRAEGN